MLRVFSLLLMLLGAAILGAPSAAGSAHDLAHAKSPVAAGQHHHHGPDGAVIDIASDHDESDESRSDGGILGHSHPASGPVDVAQSESSAAVVSERIERISPTAKHTEIPPPRSWSPDKPPPRAA